MADEHRQSPRRAIQIWLADTARRASIKDHITFADLSCSADEITKVRHSPRHRHKSRHGRTTILHAGRPSKERYNDLDLRQSSKSPTAQKSDKRGLAERLGLYSPFRAMDKEYLSGNSEWDGPEKDQSRRRKRSVSLASTYLEPAKLTKPRARGNCKVRNSHLSLARAGTSGTSGVPGDVSETSSSLSLSTSITQPPLEKIAKTYERKPRRKTKEDRYDLKQIKRSGKIRVEKAKKKGKKQARKTPHGTTVFKDFKATNIGASRLTLRPVAKLGLFTKGRASSPVKRRGLPDLAFSEMTFLTTRRERSANETQTTDTIKEHNRQKKKRAVDVEDEISRFFTQNKPPIIEKENNDGTLRQLKAAQSLRFHRERHDKHLGTADSSKSPMELPDTPFLGFGKRGPQPPSPTRKEGTFRPSTEISMPRNVTSVSPSLSTSYYTWSQSGRISPKSVTGVAERLGGQILRRVSRYDGGKVSVTSEAPQKKFGGQVMVERSMKHSEVPATTALESRISGFERGKEQPENENQAILTRADQLAEMLPTPDSPAQLIRDQQHSSTSKIDSQLSTTALEPKFSANIEPRRTAAISTRTEEPVGPIKPLSSNSLAKALDKHVDACKVGVTVSKSLTEGPITEHDRMPVPCCQTCHAPSNEGQLPEGCLDVYHDASIATRPRICVTKGQQYCMMDKMVSKHHSQQRHDGSLETKSARPEDSPHVKASQFAASRNPRSCPISTGDAWKGPGKIYEHQVRAEAPQVDTYHTTNQDAQYTLPDLNGQLDVPDAGDSYFYYDTSSCPMESFSLDRNVRDLRQNDWQEDNYLDEALAANPSFLEARQPVLLSRDLPCPENRQTSGAWACHPSFHSNPDKWQQRSYEEPHEPIKRHDYLSMDDDIYCGNSSHSNGSLFLSQSDRTLPRSRNRFLGGVQLEVERSLSEDKEGFQPLANFWRPNKLY